MAGAAVPAAGDIGLDTVTNAQQETNLENLAEAVRRIFGVGEVTSTSYTLSAGVVTPQRGLVYVNTEGGAASDFLDVISTDHYLNNSIVVVMAPGAPTQTVVVRHLAGFTGQIVLSNGADLTLNNPYAFVMLRLVSTVWVEVARGYGTDLAGARAFLGLGSVATLNNGAVNAATLQGNAASYFLPAAGTAANSTLLAGLAASAFLRADIASLQTILGSLRAASGRLEAANSSAAGTALLGLFAGGLERGQVYFEGVSGNLFIRLLDSGGTIQAGLRIRPNEIPDFWDGAAWTPLFNVEAPAPWINPIRWDKLDAITTYSGQGETVLYTADLPVSPGSGASRVYRISAGITGERGSGNAEFRATLHAGTAGDATDPEIGRSILMETPLDNVLVLAEVLEEDYILTSETKITLVLKKTTAPSINIQPSVMGTYKLDPKRTYLRVTQIG